jgi:hypothetical protein
MGRAARASGGPSCYSAAGRPGCGRNQTDVLYCLMLQRPGQRRANVAYYRRNRAREIERVRARQASTVAFLRDLRNVPCADCGRRYAAHQMDFDHREPTRKAFRVTAGAAMLRSRAALLDEVGKCDIVCANCHRVRTQQRPSGRPVEPGRSRYLEQRRAAWRAHSSLLDRLRDVPCADCNQRFPPCAMDFDHRDPATKRYTVTRMIGRAGAPRILAEVAKCDIVCANCHRLRTFDRRAAGHQARE